MPYHHGNLRQSLEDAAIHLIAQVGPAGFTLREVARQAGVSHNAPYRHFRSKEELLAAVGAKGFRELRSAMLAASEASPNALERLFSAGTAYVAFALSQPEHFSVMFDAPLSKEEHSDYGGAAQEAFQALFDLIATCQRDSLLPPGETLRRALVAWSLVHGISKLAVSGQLPFASRSEILAFAEQTIRSSAALLSTTVSAASSPTRPAGLSRC